MTHADMHALTVVDKWLEGELPPDDNQGAKDATLNATVDTIGGEISMDNAYLNSPANLNSVDGMDRALVPTLAEDGQGDAVAIEEEDPSAALQLNCQRSRSSERNLPTGPSKVDADGVPQSEA
nr:hypothetical protein Iba_chr02cCG9140 [Ipomoea batatas]